MAVFMFNFSHIVWGKVSYVKRGRVGVNSKTPVECVVSRQMDYTARFQGVL